MGGLMVSWTKRGDMIKKIIKKYGKSVIWEKTSLVGRGLDTIN